MKAVLLARGAIHILYQPIAVIHVSWQYISIQKASTIVLRLVQMDELNAENMRIISTKLEH